MALSLGIDVSTQGIKAELIDPADPLCRFSGVSVNFGADLPQYGAPEGFRPNPDPLIRQADPGMWLEALDLLFARMRDAGLPLAEIGMISGSGQQHGSVYLTDRFDVALRSLDPAGTLAGQLVPVLSRRYAPIWMDRSTSRECRELDERFGERLRRVTGSPAVERFTGPQIRKFARENPEAYRDTAVIHLVSSFCCSVLCGASAPIDYGDGAGMNLLNLETLAWDSEIAAFTAPGLLGKLPEVVPSNTVAGGLSPYFEKYGLKAGTPVAVWQNKGLYRPVDSDGQPVETFVKKLNGLPLVLGSDAPERTPELLTFLAQEPELNKRVKAAVRIGRRRWNILLDDIDKGITVRLPEKDPAAAWGRLAKLNRTQGLLNRKITMVDLRQPDKLIVHLEDDPAKKGKNRKKTASVSTSAKTP